MTGDDADFAAYLAARWPFLVRSLVLLGASPTEAAARVQTGLAGCYLSWERVRGADDVDVHVYRTVLDGWRKSRRRAGTTPAPRVPVAEPTDQLLLRWALEEQLAQLAPELRELLVLRYFAGLSELQLADLLELPVATLADTLQLALAQLDLAALREVRGR